MSKVFFTGCTHFGHANIIKLADRPFENIDEMDEVLVSNWNETVTPKDTVYHLGDFSWWKGNTDAKKYLNRLNGNVILIRGNHDSENWGTPYMSFKRNLAGRKRKVCLMHYPIEEWDGWYSKSIHMHAHTHKPALISAERRFNVGVDACDFRPISLDEIENVLTENEW